MTSTASGGTFSLAHPGGSHDASPPSVMSPNRAAETAGLAGRPGARHSLGASSRLTHAPTRNRQPRGCFRIPRRAFGVPQSPVSKRRKYIPRKGYQPLPELFGTLGRDPGVGRRYPSAPQTSATDDPCLFVPGLGLHVVVMRVPLLSPQGGAEAGRQPDAITR